MRILHLLIIVGLWSSLGFSVAIAQPDVGPTAVAQQEPPTPIDGRVSFTPTAPWVPLMDLDGEADEASFGAWFRTDWSRRGVHLSLHLPHASASDRIPVGRPPNAPFSVRMRFEGGEGPYELFCAPLTEPVRPMIRRRLPYLMNYRLGANADYGETEHVLCQERTQRGILPDSIHTRWRPASGNGLHFEALIPWQTLRLDTPAEGDRLPFSIEVHQADRSTLRWGPPGPERGIRFAKAGAVAENEWPVAPQVSSALVRQPETVRAAYPNPGKSQPPGSLSFRIVDAGGSARVEATAQADGEVVWAHLDTEGLPDGSYTLHVLRSEHLLAARPLQLAGTAAADLQQRRAHLRKRIEQLRERATEPWKAGHLRRAALCLQLSELGAAPQSGDLDQAQELIEDAGALLDSIAAGRRPDPAREGYDHPAGFAADGQRGPVAFEPTDQPTARLTVQAQQEADWDVKPYLYGTFSEPIGFDRPIYNMLYAQQLRNPSFEWGHPTPEATVKRFVNTNELAAEAAEDVLAGRWMTRLPAGLDEVAAPWIAVGQGPATFMLADDAYNTEKAQRIDAGEEAAEVGVAQIVSLPAWRCTSYRLRGFFRSDGQVRGARALLYHDGAVVAEASFNGIDSEWQAFEAQLETPSLSGPRNTFALAVVIDGPGRLDLDQVTLFPEDAVDGFDPQAVEQLRQLDTGWVRWPGGNYASAYHWRDGVGPRDQRPSRPNPAWLGLPSNFVGTDEFLRLAELADFEPLICVNAGNGTPEEAARWVEYVNGDTTTAMGRLRAQNGHPEPYDVRYWNIGNEQWGWWQTGYCDPAENARRYNAFARAMRAVDPSIELIACGVGAHSLRDPATWNRPLLEQEDVQLEALDVHTYVNVPARANVKDAERATLLSTIPVSYEQWLMSFREDLLSRGLDHVEINVGEYNGNARAQSSEMEQKGRLLAYAGWLHAFMRQGEYVMGANATEFSPFDPRALPFERVHPRFDLHRRYAQQAGTRPVAAHLRTPVRQQPERMGRDVVPIFNVPLVDAVALKDTTDGSLSMSLINRDKKQAIPVEVRLEDYSAQAEGRWLLFGVPEATEVREKPLPAGETFTVTLPPHSVSLLRVFPAYGGSTE